VAGSQPPISYSLIENRTAFLICSYYMCCGSRVQHNQLYFDEMSKSIID